MHTNKFKLAQTLAYSLKIQRQHLKDANNARLAGLWGECRYKLEAWKAERTFWLCAMADMYC